MASGPGRALIRARRSSTTTWTSTSRRAPRCSAWRRATSRPRRWRRYVAERAGVAPAELTLLFAPTASLAGGVQIAARIVETALHKLHELDFDVRRVVSGFGTCPLPPVAQGRRRGDRAHQRRDPLRRPGRAHRRRARRRARAARREAAGVRLARLRRAVRQGPRGGGLGLLRDRPDALQPGRGPPRERRERAELPRRGRRTRRSSSGPSGDDRRDGHDDDEPRRHRQLRGDGRGVGRGGDRHHALPPDAHAAQPPGRRRGGRQPHRRHPAVRAGGARGPAAADPARPPSSTAPSSPTRARGARSAVAAIDATGPRARVTTRVVGRGSGREFIGFNRASHAVLEASILASRGAAAAGRRDPRRAGAPGRRGGQDGRPARAGGDGLRPGARARRARRSHDDGPRRGARATAHGHARRHRDGGAPVRRAGRGGEPARGGGGGERRAPS